MAWVEPKEIPERIYLIGMPGSGKSTLGKKLASALHWQFIDLDLQIEAKEKSSIEDLFSNKGEQAFREIESSTLKSCLTNRVVIACGGGTAAFHDNMEFMLNQGWVAYLSANPAFLKDRILQSKQNRPLFKGLNSVELEKKLVEMLESRESFFSKAHAKIKLPNESLKSLIDEAFKVFKPS